MNTNPLATPPLPVVVSRSPVLIVINGGVITIPPELGQSIVAAYESQAVPRSWRPEPPDFNEWFVECLKDMFWGDGGDGCSRQAESEYSHSEGAHR